MAKLGLIFPGQGSQKVGMGKDLYDQIPSAKALFQEASDSCGRDIANICFEGPQEVLTQTQNAQLGIFLVSAALFNQLKAAGVEPTMVAGHSLGELTAYYAAGVLSLKEAIQLIKTRGEGMAASYPSEDSGMAAIMGKSPDEIQQVLTAFTDAPVVMANLNCPGQIVISGRKGPLEEASALLKTEGAKVIPLQVSGAFHSPLMQKGSDLLKTFVETLSFQNATTPIILNRTANPESEALALKTNIPLQVVSPVRWIESMATMTANCDHLVEVGPGKVLTGLARKCAPDFPITTLSELTQIDEFLAVAK